MYFHICYSLYVGFLDGCEGLRFAIFEVLHSVLIRNWLRVRTMSMSKFWQAIRALFAMDWDAFIQADSEEESRIMHES